MLNYKECGGNYCGQQPLAAFRVDLTARDGRFKYCDDCIARVAGKPTSTVYPAEIAHRAGIGECCICRACTDVYLPDPAGFFEFRADSIVRRADFNRALSEWRGRQNLPPGQYKQGTVKRAISARGVREVRRADGYYLVGLALIWEE